MRGHISRLNPLLPPKNQMLTKLKHIANGLGQGGSITLSQDDFALIRGTGVKATLTPTGGYELLVADFKEALNTIETKPSEEVPAPKKQEPPATEPETPLPTKPPKAK